MTQFVNTFEGGSNGTTLTVGNSGGGSGDAFNTVTIGTSATADFSNTHAAHGSLALKIATAGTAAQVTVIKTGLTGGTAAAVRFYLWITANPGTQVNLCNFRQSGGAFQLQVRLLTTGKLTLVNQAGTVVAASTTASAIPTGQWVRVEVSGITFNATTGAATLAYYSTADSATATESLSVTSQNFGSAVDRVAIGVLGTNTANIGPFWVDDFAVNDTGTALGPSLVTVTGSQATETDAANAGAQAISRPGTQATVTTTANAGSAAVTVTGSQAAVTNTANAGTPLVRPAGQQATETDAANTGSPTVSLPGSQANVTTTANSGAPSVSLPGVQATVTTTANAGTPTVTVAGSQATITVTGFAGTPAVSLPGAQATETDTANAGASGGSGQTVQGAQVTETDTAFAGTITVTWPGAQALEVDTANHGGAPTSRLKGYAAGAPTRSATAVARAAAAHSTTGTLTRIDAVTGHPVTAHASTGEARPVAHSAGGTS